jgi:hypothetical protein
LDENGTIQDIWDMVGWRGVLAILALVGLVIFVRGRRRKKMTVLETLVDRLAQQQAILQSISERLSPRPSIVEMIQDRISPQPSVTDRISDAAAPIVSAVEGLSQAPGSAWNTIKQTVTHG